MHNIKLTVLIGYILLIVLALIGLVRIYKELVDFSQYRGEGAEKKELIVVSNALVALYEAESLRKVVFLEHADMPFLKSSYNELDQKVRLYVDSLYHITTDEYLRLSLDTVNILLDKKKQNMMSMMVLIDTINRLSQSKIMQQTVLSTNDINNLNTLMNERLVQKRDTSYYIKEKRKFVDRLRAVFSEKLDSTKVVAVNETSELDTFTYLPSEILSDTLVHFINTINERNDKKKVTFLTQLSSRQRSMFFYDELITGQINRILHRIEEEERNTILRLVNEKETVLKRSSGIISTIGVASILVLLLFVSFTVLLVNRNQQYRVELEKSNELGKKLLQSRERLLLMISHDVKAPLSSIIGHIELMLKRRMSAEEKTHIDSIRSSSEQILDLSNKLIDHHRLEKGKLEASMIPFIPFRLIDDIYNNFVPIAAKKNLTMELQSNMEPELTCISDPLMIKQILNNLINNAIKFTATGGVYLHASIDPETNLLEISVKDTGRGIKENEKEEVFEEFRRLGTSESKQEIEGFGLGLPITKKLLDLLNGKIDLTSEYGKGAEFKISIPLTVSDEKIEQKKEDTNERYDEKMSIKVLLIDDDIALLNIYSKLLERNGATVSTCFDSTQVIDLLQKENFDMIFTDIQMPEINGFELIAKIRTLSDHYAKIPVVAVSARSDVSEKNLRSVGFSYFLSKPVPYELMKNMLYRVMKNRPLVDSPENKTEEAASKGFQSLIEYVKDDKDISLDILNTFLTDSDQKLQNLKEAVEKKDKDAIRNIAHKMLPLMTMIGAEETTEILTRIENDLQYPDEIRKLIILTEKINKEAAVFIRDFAEA